MKRFFSLFAGCAVLVLVFSMFGILPLFLLSDHIFFSILLTAAFFALLISAWIGQEEKIRALERRIQMLEHPEKSEIIEENDK